MEHTTQRLRYALNEADAGLATAEAEFEACPKHGFKLVPPAVADLSRLITHEVALRQSIALYRTLVDNSLDGVFLLQHGRVVFANRALAAMLGYAVADLIGKDYLDAVAPAWRSEQLARRASREDGSKAVFTHELGMLHKDGRQLMVRVCSAGVEYNGAIASTGTLRDITEERRAQQALQRSETLYRALVEHSQVGVFILRDGCFTYADATLAAMLDQDASELIGRPFREVVAADSLELYESRLVAGAIEALPPPDYQVVLLRRDGRRIDVTISAGEVLLDGIVHVSGTVRDFTEHRRVEAQLKYNASHDALTGLPNRQVFKQQLAKTIARARKRGRCDYALLFLDLDGFKLINDGLGHVAGDRLLIAIARRLQETLEGDAVVARYGGDEFAVLASGPCERNRAQELAKRVMHAFDAPFSIQDQEVFSAASVGIVLGRAEYDTPDTLLRDADTAMYRAKRDGKAAFVVFDEAMHAAAHARFQLGNDLRRALERQEFRVHYQPIVDLASGQIVGCEALARWQHPQRGLLEPGDFLQVAAETGIIVGLDWWVLNASCRLLGRWQQRFGTRRPFVVNVNLDERQLDDRRFVSRLSEAIRASRIDPKGLALEVTETVFRSGRTDLQDLFGRLKRLGVSLVVDDFGTGYSSLESFAASPFDVLKIDRSFVQDMDVNPRHRAIVRTISGFAEDLNLRLTAEGVETENQAKILSELGCATAQGFLYSKPVTPEEMEMLLERGLASPLPLAGEG